jgi:hypothetical protein
MRNFFDNGEIQVSSFHTFRNYKDEMQGDFSEGDLNLAFRDEQGTMHMLMGSAGMNAYILSTTNHLTNRVINDFRGKCAIKINHPTLFGLDLSKKLPFVSSGVEGNCDYVDSKVNFLDKNRNTEHVLNLIKQDRIHDANHALKTMTMGVELFAKDLKYRHQNEYRFIWFGRKEVKSSLLVSCPELIQYCEPIEF